MITRETQDALLAAAPGLRDVVTGLESCLAAVSGGVDSLTLAVVAHRLLPGRFLAAHAVSPAVPADDTRRVRETAAAEGFHLLEVDSGEFSDPEYLRNPRDRCFFCKTHLYAALTELAARELPGAVLVSGANADDLGEYRPGLLAAKHFSVRHPFVEAGMDKTAVRALARALDLPFADLPASPCLSSRIYVGTPVTAERLAAAAYAEKLFKKLTGLAVVRCRLRGSEMLVETQPEALRGSAGGRTEVLAAVEALRDKVPALFPTVNDVRLDPEGYRPGKSFQQPQ